MKKPMVFLLLVLLLTACNALPRIPTGDENCGLFVWTRACEDFHRKQCENDPNSPSCDILNRRMESHQSFYEFAGPSEEEEEPLEVIVEPDLQTPEPTEENFQTSTERCDEPDFQVGDRVWIGTYHILTDPGSDTIAPGSEEAGCNESSGCYLTVVGGPVCTNGENWWLVRGVSDSVEGWQSERPLIPDQRAFEPTAEPSPEQNDSGYSSFLDFIEAVEDLIQVPYWEPSNFDLASKLVYSTPYYWGDSNGQAYEAEHDDFAHRLLYFVERYEVYDIDVEMGDTSCFPGEAILAEHTILLDAQFRSGVICLGFAHMETGYFITEEWGLP